MIDLPLELSSKAKILAGEFAWKPQDVLDVLQWAKDENLAILGVELWNERKNAPVWIASSDYECDSSDWNELVSCCANEAKNFVHKFWSEPGALFNLTISEKNAT